MTELIRIGISRMEGAQLAQLVDDFRDLVGTERDLTDPAVARLAPNPYPEDDDAAEAFESVTRDDLLDRRSVDAEVVRLGLADLRGDLGSLTRDEAFVEHDIAIPVAEVESWLRTLTALRLVIASRLGIDTEEADDPEDPRYGVYDWLGYRLELLIQAADTLL